MNQRGVPDWLEVGNKSKGGAGSRETCRDIEQVFRHTPGRRGNLWTKGTNVRVLLTQMVSEALEMMKAHWKMVYREER